MHINFKIQISQLQHRHQGQPQSLQAFARDLNQFQRCYCLLKPFRISAVFNHMRFCSTHILERFQCRIPQTRPNLSFWFTRTRQKLIKNVKGPFVGFVRNDARFFQQIHFALTACQYARWHDFALIRCLDRVFGVKLQLNEFSKPTTVIIANGLRIPKCFQ